ncbi:hypothetical protein CDAR_560751 [Caerostris darwini]|uniref:Uncharacterized protein n=1 Tax=Caerostris darwini TaxID=1538125 RepID=A0AAV4PCT0_9ARAC|nr:hypothetical protein CDAR_560661 [Caerostris darwini]GIX94906.1 hypothetical protein CDAR_560751 [Caerostris darwini]
MPVLNLDLVDLASSNPYNVHIRFPQSSEFYEIRLNKTSRKVLAQKKARICVGLGMAQARDFEIDIPPTEYVERWVQLLSH